MTCYKTEHPSPLGLLTLASDGENLTGLWMENQKFFCAGLPGDAIQKDDLPVFAAVRNWLDAYFAGERPLVSEIPMAPAGSPFRQQVWQILTEIPCGQVITYGDIARKLGTGCAQAVGGAVGHNPISILIPCHRVLGAGGTLTGYAGGTDRKRFLLALEGIDISQLK